MIPSLNTQEELIAEAKRFHTKKRLGQNFLVDPEKLELLVESLDIQEGDLILEIGPGIGFLSRLLSRKKALVYAVELDRDCVARLEIKGFKDFHVIHQDFLQFNISEILEKHPGKKLKVIGNVPYQITGRILVHLLGEIDKPQPWLQSIERIVVTVQKEVAQRFTAKPGTKDYSQLTMLLNYYSKPEILAIIEKESFFPPPKVTSAIARLSILPEPSITYNNRKLLKKLIEAGFNQRRKMLRNNLSFLGLSEDQLRQIFSAINFDPQCRAENLSLEQFAKLGQAIEKVLEI